jgi:hypothetical protein
MKKLFIVTLAVLFLSGAAYAVEYDYSGMINTRGSYISNSTGESSDAGNYMYYDMEFDSTLKIKPTDKSLIYLNWEIHDENWVDTPGGSDTKTGDDQIAFKRAFGSVNFDMGGTLDFGLMTGGAWATAFGDNADGKYRLKWRQDTGAGPIFVILEKNHEEGPSATGDYDAEADDSDAYYVAMVTKFGDIYFKPLLGISYVGNVEADEETDVSVTVVSVGLDGAFGDIGFEAEFNYRGYAYETDFDAEDYSTIGVYGNAWMNIDAAKVGLMAAYGSYDEDGGIGGAGGGFGFGEDFGPGYWVMDWEHFGSGNAEYYAATLVALYGSYAVNDALSLNGALEYMMSNEKDTRWEEATGTIFNFGLGYALADNVKYSVGVAQGQFNGDDFADDLDPFIRVFHKI